MTKAIAPSEIPPVPENMSGWRRSLRRGSIFHLHFMGLTACRSLVLERHKSEPLAGVGDMQFWGVCPRCFSISKKEAA
jgi:hypothetical protein